MSEVTETEVSDASESKRLIGVVSSKKEEKGFGFIEAEDGRDYFFHHSEVYRSSISFKKLQVGMKVSFSPTENENPYEGPKAIGVKLEKE